MDEQPQIACTLGDHGKPVFSFGDFLGALTAATRQLPHLAGAYLPPTRLGAGFREKVMIAVSGLNRCRHCTAIHTTWGELTGLSKEEISHLVDFDPTGLEPRELAAVAYARCLVAGRDTTEVEAFARQHYGEAELARIAAVARGIDFANKCGNTWDDFVDRLKGRGGAPESTLHDEILVLAALAPVGLPFLAVSKTLRTLREQPDLG